MTRLLRFLVGFMFGLLFIAMVFVVFPVLVYLFVHM